uniref:DUF8003 domain-containing protein n=1 Tax=Kalanchoe fedtschenkoi TaxID=63787 RepID=A0A7N1A4F4_KALFE
MPSQGIQRFITLCCILLGSEVFTACFGGTGEHTVSSHLLGNQALNSLQFVGDSITTSLTSPTDDLPPSSSCADLKGVGSFNSTCLLNSNLYLSSDLYVHGTGNLEILPDTKIICPYEGCSLTFNLSGTVKFGRNAAVVGGTVVIAAVNLSLEYNSSINTTSLGGPPPTQTTGTPSGDDRAGGGHGGRGANCYKHNKTTYWGGDVYAWSSLSSPWSYGSKGGHSSFHRDSEGKGGGRVKLEVNDTISLNGSVTAEGGDGGKEGGGGSGGSIIIRSRNLRGFGFISAAGGRGWGGGGGGRISLGCYSIQEDLLITAQGGFSIGCPRNAGGAGTYFDSHLRRLRVGNNNYTTDTETPLLDFPISPLLADVYVENQAIALVPLLWTRVQVRGQIQLLSGGCIVFGLFDSSESEFELVAEELLLSDSTIKVYGAFRISVKMLLMWNSKIQIDGGEDSMTATSILEIRNLIVLKENSVIGSTTNLGLYGQGMLKLAGHGDVIRAQRLLLALFYNVTIGPGSLLQAPLDDVSRSSITEPRCKTEVCPTDLISPPDDCHVNSTLSFSLQICRVEDVLVIGLIKGSIIHIHRARTLMVDTEGTISASELGCGKGLGSGIYSNGAGGGAGHGGRGGAGYYKGKTGEGGRIYGNSDLPCELGSGASSPNEGFQNIAGGGIIVMGSKKWPLLKIDIYGSIRADGQSYSKGADGTHSSLLGGLGGGSGGTILAFLQVLTLFKNSTISAVGGNGGFVGGGGGGGGRIHFHWSKIRKGDEYIPLALVSGDINSSGGAGNSGGIPGESGTLTGKMCPVGLYGTFCDECPIGTYKDVEGSDPDLCTPCSLAILPARAEFIYIRGGVTKSSCPYKCVSDKYRMPNCYTPLEDLMYTFGGPLPFAILLSVILVLLAFLLSTLRVKLLGSDSCHGSGSVERSSHSHYPYLLSLSEVRGARVDESQSHVHRMYFMGPNTFGEPWHLPYSPPDAITKIVYEDAFNRFIDEVNSVAAYNWWEGSVHSILSLLAYPCAWSWKQWRRRRKVHCLHEFVKSGYDHSCLCSCRSRALYKGMKVGATPDLMIAYIDFFLGGDEKRIDIVSIIQKRFPMCVMFGGDGSYMSPYNLYSDTLLTNLLGQHVPASVWNRFVAGLNAQLRTVRHGSIRSTLHPVIHWINSHGNPQLEFHSVRIDLGWFQVTSSGYYQLGILVIVGNYSFHSMRQNNVFNNIIEESPSENSRYPSENLSPQHDQSFASTALSRKKVSRGINGGLINEATITSLYYRRDFLFPLSLILHNTRPVGRRNTLQLLITLMLLADLSVTLLILVQFYWISLLAFLAILLILPLSLLSPFPAGLSALFSREPRRASLARIYALWNVTSFSNIAVAFISGIARYGYYLLHPPENTNSWSYRSEDDKWWMLPTILLLLKSMQARLVDWHIANLEVQDISLFSPDPDAFWAHESAL